MLPAFPGELVWTIYACEAYFVGQLLLELMTYRFGALYSIFGGFGVIVLSHA